MLVHPHFKSDRTKSLQNDVLNTSPCLKEDDIVGKMKQILIIVLQSII